MSRYPQLRSASIPALWAVQRHYGWCTPGGHPPGGRGDGRHARLPASRWRASTTSFATAPVGRHRVLVCHNISCWMNGGDELLEAFCEATGADRTRPPTTAPARRRRVLRQGLRVPRRLRHRADGVDRRALLRPARRRRRAARRSRRCAPATSRCPTRRSPTGPPPAAPSPSPTRASMPSGAPSDGAMPETRVLFRDIDAPGLATIDGYREHGGYQALERAFRELEPGGPDRRARGVGPARPRRRRLLDGQEGLVPAPRRDGEVPLLQRRRVRARRVQGPRADDEEPAPADRGLRDRGARGRRHPRLHLHPRRVLGGRRHPRPRRRRGLRGRLPGREHPRHRHPGRARRPPRRRRLHLRRGDGAARRARGQARQPAAEAAVPRDPGPLRRPDADQQRRDALQRPPHRQQRRRLVQGLRHRAVAGDEGGLGLRLRAAARATTRSSSGSRRARSSTTSPAARPRAGG